MSKKLKTYTVWILAAYADNSPAWVIVRKVDEDSPRGSEACAKRWELDGYKTRINAEKTKG